MFDGVQKEALDFERESTIAFQEFLYHLKELWISKAAFIRRVCKL